MAVTGGEFVFLRAAALLDWDTHFVPGLLGPLLTRPEVQLVKGCYERPMLLGAGTEVGAERAPKGAGAPFEGRRGTELVARPLIRLLFPELGGVLQPLAGEWAVRRSL